MNAHALTFTGYRWPVSLPLPKRVTRIDRIKRAVATYYSSSVSEMESRRRDKYAVRARHVAMYLAREHTPASLPEIGREFGGRDHTTVIHALRRIKHLRRTDADLNNDIVMLSAWLEAAA